MWCQHGKVGGKGSGMTSGKGSDKAFLHGQVDKVAFG
jgi:hypothetical protein